MRAAFIIRHTCAFAVRQQKVLLAVVYHCNTHTRLVRRSRGSDFVTTGIRRRARKSLVDLASITSNGHGARPDTTCEARRGNVADDPGEKPQRRRTTGGWRRDVSGGEKCFLNIGFARRGLHAELSLLITAAAKHVYSRTPPYILRPQSLSSLCSIITLHAVYIYHAVTLS